jgi:membrane protease YdiL (CAAX protease family)
VSIDEGWKQRRISAIVGGLIGQFLGNALAEETMFRGFLLPQLYLIAIATRRHRAALAFALIGSSLLFAVTHLPNRIYVHGYSGSDFLWDQIGLLLFGLIMAAAYLVTRNLFIAVGLHSLLNEPTPVIRASDTMLYAVWSAMTLLLLLAWWLIVITRRPADE